MRCLGLSEPTVLHPWGDWWKKADFVRSYQLGNFNVEEYDHLQGGVSMLTCCCGRSDAVMLTNEDVAKANPVLGLCACDVCQDEIRDCKHPRDQVAAWVRQNRSRIKEDECLRLPVSLTRLVSDGNHKRPRRFVYEVFHETKLDSKVKVLHTCGCTECVNPYHMVCTASCRTKLTPAIKHDLEQWLLQKTPHKQILDLVSHKYKVSLSLRTIGSFKKSLQQSLSTQRCSPC